MPTSRKLTDQERADIRALKGHVQAVDVAERFQISRHTVHAIWQGRGGGVVGRPVRRLTDELRGEIIGMRTSGATIPETMAATGFAEITIRQVMRDARAEGDPRLTKSAVVADTAGAGASESPACSPAPAAPPPRMMVKLNDTVRRMRDSFKAKGMAPEMALREALRIYAGSAVDARGGARAAGGGGGSFHAQNMQENGR